MDAGVGGFIFSAALTSFHARHGRQRSAAHNEDVGGAGSAAIASVALTTPSRYALCT